MTNIEVAQQANLATPVAAEEAPASFEQPLGFVEQAWNLAIVRRIVLIAMLLIVWQVYARWLNRPLLLPTFVATVAAFCDSLLHGDLLARVGVSLEMLLVAYGIGICIAGVLTGLAATTRIGSDLLEILTAMLNPLPAVALLPIALSWFGLGWPSILFVLVHAVLWPVALNAHSGFSSVSPTLRMVGQSYGLSGFAFVWRILIPAAFPSLLTGLKTGWAFAWRTLIAAEMVFGVSSGSGGLGWFIYENKNQLETARVFAGLGTVILIGLVTEVLVFRTIENLTVRRWGMKSS